MTFYHTIVRFAGRAPYWSRKIVPVWVKKAPYSARRWFVTIALATPISMSNVWANKTTWRLCVNTLLFSNDKHIEQINITACVDNTRGPSGPWNAHMRQKILKSSLFSLLYVQQATPGRCKSEGLSFKM